MSTDSTLEASLAAAAEAIREADALLIGAGAGMGVDSGLPDFRGPEGFWKAYPPFRGREFAEMSNPHWFTTDPSLAWGFFGHRLGMYRAALPHEGFDILRRWSDARPAFIYTSNVDGQFQKAGFSEEMLVECHGSIYYLQCLADCGQPIWPAAEVRIEVEEATIRARSELPRCPGCGALARPNILMFGDGKWDPSRTVAQEARYDAWLRERKNARIVAIELGAGLAIRTVRRECELRAQTLIRINPREPATPSGGVPIPLGAREALRRIDALLAATP